MMTLNKYVFLGIMLASLPTFTAAFAANFNLQPYTTCRSDGFCYTAVDVSVLGLNAAKISALKSVNITNFLNKVGVGFQGISYAWSGNVLNVSGWVKPGTNNYWSFSAGGDTYDPWWNYSTTTWTTHVWNNPDTLTSPVGGLSNFKFGVHIMTVNKTVQIISFEKNPSTVATHGFIIDHANTTLFTCGFVGNLCNFTSAYLNASTSYWIVSNCTTRLVDTTSAYPHVTDDFNVTNGAWSQNGANFTEQTEMYDIEYITSASNVTETNSTFYSYNFTINGNSANLSADVGTAINATVALNVSGLNSTLYRNGTILNTTLGNISNINSTLTVGVYNYTYANNNSDSATYWVTIEAASASSTGITFTYNVDLNDAPLTCMNTTHAQRNTTIYNNGTATPLGEVYKCPYDCDNITAACSPNPMMQNIYVIGIFLAFCFILIAIWKWA